MGDLLMKKLLKSFLVAGFAALSLAAVKNVDDVSASGIVNTINLTRMYNKHGDLGYESCSCCKYTMESWRI
jgi:hypothetical protein